MATLLLPDLLPILVLLLLWWWFTLEIFAFGRHFGNNLSINSSSSIKPSDKQLLDRLEFNCRLVVADDDDDWIGLANVYDDKLIVGCWNVWNELLWLNNVVVVPVWNGCGCDVDDNGLLMIEWVARNGSFGISVKLKLKLFRFIDVFVMINLHHLMCVTEFYVHLRTISVCCFVVSNRENLLCFSDMF